MMKKLATLLLLILINQLNVLAQSSNAVEMATGLRSSGKIYVVVLVIVLLFVGVTAYLITIDRKLNKLEKRK
ncbi:MAG TPA: hypothetical protein VKZ78_09400 [Sphingobacteriaceae bacterium]|nr:hypothetical protein [Sphingobacteriaceae bacterium]